MFSQADHPSLDVVEVIVFGPGYGESIAVHIGQGDWIIVDSCLDENKAPVAKRYLDTLGVLPERVKYIVVSHWHDDHTRGISELAQYYHSARIGVSNVLNSKEGKIFATAYSGAVTELGRGTKELYTIFRDHKKRIDPLSQNTILLPSNGNGGGLVQALSPTSECYWEVLKQIHNATPTPGKSSPIKEAPQLSPNNEAVAIHIDTGLFAIVLGSDLETSNAGWTTVITHPNCLALKPADFYKVAHHGSETAECSAVWASLLSARPVSVLTPFNHGNVSLPREVDKQRIAGKSSNFHTSSQGSRKPAMDYHVSRRLLTMGSSPIPLNTKLGAVRSRKSLANAAGAAGWTFSYFGAASQIVV